MIWIIVSLPFWISSAIFAIIGCCALIRAISYAGRISQIDFNLYITGAILALSASGILALVAAKIMS